MPPYLFFLFSYLLLSSTAEADENKNARKTDIPKSRIGAIVDYSTRVGKEESIAMGIAAEDYYSYTKHRPVLHIAGSGNDLTHIASTATKLIKKKRAGAIILSSWKLDETILIAELGSKAQVPVLTLADTSQSLLSSKGWPFLIQAAHSHHHQMRAVAAILETWQWRKVNIIYEDSSFAIIKYLIETLREAGISIEHLLSLPLLPTSLSMSEELEKLKHDQCRVFIVHSSLPLAKDLFFEAKKLGLMDKDSVWITTNSITDLLSSANVSIISSMQGVLGIKTYIPQTLESFKKFKSKFQRSFFLEYPHELSFEPGMFALQAYDALWSVAIAMWGRTNQTSISSYQGKNEGPLHGQKLFENVLQSNFAGLMGEFHFNESKLPSTEVFQIVNVVHESFRELGYWSNNRGFSANIKEGAIYNNSMKILQQVIWPGGSRTSIPRGWAVPKPLVIGVPLNATFKQFMNVEYNHIGEPSISGFALEVFKAVKEKMPYEFPHVFNVHNGSYDSMVEQIYLKNYDAVVGDTTIVASRTKYGDFSQPWMDSGLQMVVLKKLVSSNQPWLFTKPFTVGTWLSIGGLNIFNGFVIWLMERKHYEEFNGSIVNIFGVLIWLAFTTLFSLHSDRLHSNFSRVTMVMWLFVALVTIQSYTASLSSMLTVPRINPNEITLEFLLKTNAKVGCDEVSFVVKYLEEVLHFSKDNIRKVTSEIAYPEALVKGEITAAFLEVPYINIFLAKNCKRFTAVGPIYKVGGFGFVFPRGSQMLDDVSQAILEISENGKLLKLEEALMNSHKCSDSNSDPGRLGLSSFWGLFSISGIATVLCLLGYLVRSTFISFFHANPEENRPVPIGEDNPPAPVVESESESEPEDDQAAVPQGGNGTASNTTLSNEEKSDKIAQDEDIEIVVGTPEHALAKIKEKNKIS